VFFVDGLINKPSNANNLLDTVNKVIVNKIFKS